MIAGLRRRRILLDSPRVLAREEREAASAPLSRPFGRCGAAARAGRIGAVRALPARRLDETAGRARRSAPRARAARRRARAPAQRRATARSPGSLARDSSTRSRRRARTRPSGRRALVPTLGPAETAAAWLQLRDGSGLDLPGGSFLIDADERATLLPLLQARKESFFIDFADRPPPALRRDAGGRRSSPSATPRSPRCAAFDAPRLPDLIAMRDAMTAAGWSTTSPRATRSSRRSSCRRRPTRRASWRRTGRPSASGSRRRRACRPGERVVRHVQRRSPDPASLDEDLRHAFMSHPQRRGLLHLPLRQFPDADQEVDLGRRRLAGASRPPQRPRRAAAGGSRAARCPRAARSTSGPATSS